MEPRRKHRAAVIAGLVIGAGTVASTGAHEGGDSAQLAKVHFKVECNARGTEGMGPGDGLFPFVRLGTVQGAGRPGR